SPVEASKTAEVWCTNANKLPNLLLELARVGDVGSGKQLDAFAWLKSGYRPTPTIVEAARRVFAGHNVRDLSHAYADNLSGTTDGMARVIEQGRANGRRVVCFVTGVPGSGKTLAGLTAMQDARASELGPGACAFMSGNGPLVRVLRAALIRDEMSKGNPREEAKRHTELLVQSIHTFINEYCLRKQDAVPPEHVIAFDEAQRAWHAAKVTKHHKGRLNRSEPDLVLDIMARAKSWSVVVAIVGGGQEIHDGEAGLEEW